MNGSHAVETTSGGMAPQLLLTPEEAANRLAICRTRVYELMGSGQLESVRIGSSRRVPHGGSGRVRSATSIWGEHRGSGGDPGSTVLCRPGQR